MSKLTSAVGVVLIAAAGALAALSSSHEDVLNANKSLCEKYTKNAESALASKDYKGAIKFAKLAIKSDPSNKSGYKVLTKISNAQCSGNTPAASSTTQTTGATTPAKGAEPAKKPAAALEEEEEMGC